MHLTNNKRGKAKFYCKHTVRSNYQEFKKLYPKVPYITYMAIYEDFIKEIVHQIIEHSFDFRLPSRLGDLGIRKVKIEKTLNDKGEVESKNRPVNYKKTIELWYELYGTTDKEELNKIDNKPLVRFDNRHTGGYTFYVAWDKSTCNVKNQTKYRFIPCKKFKTLINKISREKNIDYYETEW